MGKIIIGKGSKKQRAIPQKYIPKNLSKKDKKKQEKSILEKRMRPKLNSFKSKRSGWVSKFELKYGFKINNFTKINQKIISMGGIKQIIKKGEAAYYNGGSRPNQTPRSWALARLASVILGGPARKVDINIWNKYKK